MNQAFREDAVGIQQHLSFVALTQAASFVQKVARGWLARRAVSDMMHRTFASIKIAAMWRGKWVREKIEAIRAANQTQFDTRVATEAGKYEAALSAARLASSATVDGN